jgi:hypothetical protein
VPFGNELDSTMDKASLRMKFHYQDIRRIGPGAGRGRPRSKSHPRGRSLVPHVAHQARREIPYIEITHLK